MWDPVGPDELTTNWLRLTNVMAVRLVKSVTTPARTASAAYDDSIRLDRSLPGSASVTNPIWVQLAPLVWLDCVLPTDGEN